MKTSLAIIAIVFFLTTCIKVKDRNCEEWEVTDHKTYHGAGIDWSCAGSRTYQLVFCDNELSNVTPGYTKTIGSGDCVTTRTFNRFIRKW